MNNSYIEQQIAQAGAGFSSVEAEREVITALLKSQPRPNEFTLAETDFSNVLLGRIYSAMQYTASKSAVDAVTVIATLETLYGEKAEILKAEMFKTLKQSIGTKAMLDTYTEIIRRLSVRRKCVNAVKQSFDVLSDPANDMDAAVDALRTQLIQLTTAQGHEWTGLSQILLNTFSYLEKRTNGEIKSITTGISSLDKLIGGFFGGELTVIGARPAVGKSAFALNIAYEAALQGNKVGILSREMTDIQLGTRMLARGGTLDGMKLRKAELEDNDWCDITDAMQSMSALDISFLFNVKTVEELRKLAQTKVENGELDMLIVDYLQLMDTTQRFRDEHLRVGKISGALKDMAVDFNIPVIALAQVNRDTDGQLPKLSSLKASGDIEQDADGVIFLHRPEDPQDSSVNPRDKETWSAWTEQGYDYLSVSVAKQRQGAIGKTNLLFDKAHMRYCAIDRDR